MSWSLFRTSFSRTRTTLSLPFLSLRPLLRCNFSFAVDTVNVNGDGSGAPEPLHPWPEWVSFVDRLRIKGYLTEASETSHSDVSEGRGDGASLYKSTELLIDPCLRFARDRFDLLKSLSREDIQTVVQSGCPNLVKKAVSSAKRLRAYVRLDEGDVCSACTLRGSCGSAFSILKASEASARTVDIVRILLVYALDPLVYGEERPFSRELIEASTRKLLSELIQLSEKSPNPPLPKVVSRASDQKVETLNHMDGEPSQDVEMRKGDWMCPKCNFLNFSRNTHCLKCREDHPRTIGVDGIEMRKGDWICEKCTFMNFARNIRCLKCKADGPKRVDEGDIEMKKGDWNCPQCAFMNFASKKNCLRCREPRPTRQLNPGEWECPSCDFFNYSRNRTCLKCNSERPIGTN